MQKTDDQNKMNLAAKRCLICNSIKEQDFKYTDTCKNCFDFLSHQSGDSYIEITVYAYRQKLEKQIYRLEKYLLKNSDIDFENN